VEALLFRTMLEEAGIDVEERLMESTWLAGVSFFSLHSQLLVRAADAARAHALVAAFRARDESEQMEGG
jgi:hypothetical protein